MVLKSIDHIIPTSSPLSYLARLIEQKFNEDYTLQISIYESGGQGITLSREIFDWQCTNDIVIKLQDHINNLSNNKELALHSKVKVKDNELHIPMIDFATEVINNELYEKVSIIAESFNAKFKLFKSGRSYHGYFNTLITKNDWIKYLGALLLLNKPYDPFEYIDSRWIGHALEHGYSALRVSYNSNFYKQIPEEVTM